MAWIADQRGVLKGTSAIDRSLRFKNLFERGRSLFYDLCLTKPKTYMIRPTGRNLASISRMDHCWHKREVKTHSESNVVEA